MQWRTLRSGIADLHRRAEVSQNALNRYANAVAQRSLLSLAVVM